MNEETLKVKPYKFRELTADDIVPMTTILQKINIEEFQRCFNEQMIEKIVNIFVSNTGESEKAAEGEEGANVAGVKANEKMTIAGISLFPSLLSVAQVIVTNVPKCEKEIFRFLASVSGISVEEIRKMKMGAFFRMVLDFVKFVKEEGFSDFF